MSWFRRKFRPAQGTRATSAQQQDVVLYTSRLRTPRGEVNLCITMSFEGEAQNTHYYLSVDGIGRGDCYTDTNYNDSNLSVVYGVARLFEQVIAAGASPEPITFRYCWQAQYAGTVPGVKPKDDHTLTAYNILVEYVGQKEVNEAYNLSIHCLPIQIRQVHQRDIDAGRFA